MLNIFRWWLATKVDEPNRILGYLEAVNTVSNGEDLRIIADPDKGMDNLVNGIFKISIESNTNTLLLVDKDRTVHLFPQHQITPQTRCITNYWFSGSGLNSVKIFSDLSFGENSLGHIESRLALHGQLDDKRELNTSQATEIFNIIKLSNDGTCVASCLIDDAFHQYYILKSPADRITARTHRARPYIPARKSPHLNEPSAKFAV